MNEKILSYLKGEGFTYLWQKFGPNAYKPMKGSLIILKTFTSKIYLIPGILYIGQHT